MHHPSIIILISLRLTSGSPSSCGPGEAACPEDGRCYPLNTRGPCQKDQVFLSSSRGPGCRSFIDLDESENTGSNSIPQEKESKIRNQKQASWTLPLRGQTPSDVESFCLAQEKVNTLLHFYFILNVIKLAILSRFTGLWMVNATAS